MGRLKTGWDKIYSNLQIRNTHFVIPAQAGIQTVSIQKYAKVTVIPNLWIFAAACPRVGGGRNDGCLGFFFVKAV